MKIKPYLLSILSLIAISASQAIAAPPRCDGIFWRDQVIQSLANLRLDLDLAQAQGQMGPQVTALERDYETKEAELIEYVEIHHLMSRAELMEKIREYIQQAQSLEQEISREESENRKDQEVQIDVSLAGGALDFHPVKPGKFRMGGLLGKNVTLTTPIEFGVKPVTLGVWHRITETAQMKFPGRFSRLQLDPTFHHSSQNAVDHAAYPDVLLWFQALNALAESNDPVVGQFILGHRNGDRYRLPTEAEWEYVARGLGVSAQGTEISIYGGTYEVVADAYQKNLPGGTDPLVKGEGNYDPVMRRAYFLPNGKLKLSTRWPASGSSYASSKPDIFRIVRVPKSNP